MNTKSIIDNYKDVEARYKSHYDEISELDTQLLETIDREVLDVIRKDYPDVLFNVRFTCYDGKATTIDVYGLDYQNNSVEDFLYDNAFFNQCGGCI